jgi:hypothetical protein
MWVKKKFKARRRLLGWSGGERGLNNEGRRKWRWMRKRKSL